MTGVIIRYDASFERALRMLAARCKQPVRKRRRVPLSANLYHGAYQCQRGTTSTR